MSSQDILLGLQGRENHLLRGIRCIVSIQVAAPLLRNTHTQQILVLRVNIECAIEQLYHFNNISQSEAPKRDGYASTINQVSDN
ncbi:hypothetical protein L917_13628 [Phytophthora nicotianae]|uniref:Uncharacterized protein n=1 Tax=Phytophthora nicotianae TaxID=4792 RepID=W2KPJ4_PHYNI|nr:hypothetical protein L917_13628 [Phytophthora nicotianae]